MPKMKSHSGAKKRFRKTASDKRHLGRPVEVAKSDARRVERLLHK